MSNVALVDGDAPDPPALVLGRGITALGVVRSLAAAGVPALCASRDLGFVGSSRFCRRTENRIDRPEDLAEFLRGLPYDSAVLFGCSDAWVRAIATLEPGLRSRFTSSSPPRDTVEVLLDKRRLGETLARLDLPHPRTVTLSSARDLERIDDEQIARSFLKPADSQICAGRHRVKGFDVSSRSQATALLGELAVDGLEFVLQEYVSGSPFQHYFIDGFVDGNGVLRTTFARRRLRMHPLPYGNSSYFASISSAGVESAIETLSTLFEELRFRGIFSAEFKFDDCDRQFKLLEVNIRPWWFVEFASRCGVNVCHMAYRDALGEPVEQVREYQVDAPCIHFSTDLFAVARLVRDQPRSVGPALMSWVGARDAVFRLDDPIPGLHDLVSRAARRVSRVTRG